MEVPPPGNFHDWSRDDWIAAVDANMLTAIFLIKGVLDGMIERQFGRIINITSSAVKAPISYLGLSNGARSGLTGFVAGIARESNTVRNNVTINNILPGAFDTDRVATLMDAETRQQRIAEHPAGRFGDPDEFGQLCAFLCGVQAGYITGPEHSDRWRKVPGDVLAAESRLCDDDCRKAQIANSRSGFDHRMSCMPEAPPCAIEPYA